MGANFYLSRTVGWNKKLAYLEAGAHFSQNFKFAQQGLILGKGAEPSNFLLKV